MNSPSPSKPKWSPGGAIRRTSTILSIGRSKTPSRSSSIHESDSSPLKGVVVTPTASAPKPVSSKSTLSTGSPSKEPTATPSKSTLARMGTALRRPSSLIPRRRTTSTASSFRDDSTPSKTISASRPSTESQSIAKSTPTAEPAAETQVSEVAVPGPRPSISESTHVTSTVIESTETQFVDKVEEIASQGLVEQPLLSTSHEHTAPTAAEAHDEPLTSSTTELALIAIVAEQISAEMEAEKSSLVPISSKDPASEQSGSQPEAEKSSPALTSPVEPVSEQINSQPLADKSSLVPISAFDSAPEQIGVRPEAEKSSLAPISTTEPPSELLSTYPEVDKLSLTSVIVEHLETHSEVEEPYPLPHSTAESAPTPSVSSAITPLPEAEKQPAVVISTTPATPVSSLPEPTDPAHNIVKNTLPSAGPAPHGTIVEEPPVAASPSPVVETGVAPSTPVHMVSESLREVSSLNSSFEDLALSTQPAEDEIVIIHKDAVVDHPSVLLMPVDDASVPPETKEEEKVSPVAVMSATEGPSSIKGPEPIPEATKEGDHRAVTEAPAPGVPVLPRTQQLGYVQQDWPLEIPTTSMESVAPSPAATHPLLPFEVQETSVRQNNAQLGYGRDHHAKTPQEYRSMLKKLLDGLVDLIRYWRRCLW